MSKSTAPGFNTHAMLPPVELFVGVPSGMIRGYLKVLQDRQCCKGPGIRGVSPEAWLLHRGTPSAPTCPPPSFEACACSPPQPPAQAHQGLNRRSCFTREQATDFKAPGPPPWAWGQAITHSFIHSFVHPTDA